LAIDPAGKFVYVINVSSNDISAYAVNARSGALTQVAGSPFAGGPAPFGVAIDPKGKFLYVPDVDGTYVSGFAINASTGALAEVPGSPFYSGDYPNKVAIDGSFVYVTNSISGDVSAYVIDAKTGALTQVQGSPFATGLYPVGIAIDPSGAFVYVTNYTEGSHNDISAYAVNEGTGALTQLQGSPFEAGEFPNGIAIDPTGEFAYIADSGFANNHARGRLSAFAINASSGALTQLNRSPFRAVDKPFGVAIR
jgi:6-phosphogluconolactonase (cycloisomerase 2 family)